jgi:hypothetical protein
MHHSHIASISMAAANVQELISVQVQFPERVLPVFREALLAEPVNHTVQRPFQTC